MGRCIGAEIGSVRGGIVRTIGAGSRSRIAVRTSAVIGTLKSGGGLFSSDRLAIPFMCIKSYDNREATSVSTTVHDKCRTKGRV